jgi:hypothetical protein
MFITIIGSVFFFGCTDFGRVHNRMALAESQMQTYPDSALTTIMSVDRRQLRTPKDRARHALIYSQALDKNYIDVTNDSLTRIAVNYYDRYGPARERITAKFYHGRVLRNSGEYIKAMLAFLDAEQDIETTGDNYIAGLIYTQMGDIYKHYCDYTKSFEAYSKSRDHYEKAGLIQHRNYALLEMGAICLNTHNTDIGIKNLNLALAEAEKCVDSTLIKLCLGELMMLYDSSFQYDKAFEAFQTLYNNFTYPVYSTYIAGTIAHIYAAIKDKNNALNYIEYGWKISHNKRDSTTMFFHSARVFVQFKDYKQAYIYYNNSIELQLNLLEETLRQPIISAQKDYFRQKSERNHQRYTISKIVASTIAAFGIAISLAIVKYMRYRIRLKNEEINRYMATVNELQSTIRQHGDMAPLLERLLKDRLQLIDELGNMYYEQPNTRKQQEHIYCKVKSVIDDLSNNRKTLDELEDIVNKCRDNKMARLRKDMPELKEKDFKLACYLFAGFSNRIICIFTGDSIENVYKRKSRLKAKIAASNTPSRGAFSDTAV